MNGGTLLMPLDPEARHDRDWLETKASDAFFEETLRYPDIAQVIVQLQPRRLLDVGCGSGYLAKLPFYMVPHLRGDLLVVGGKPVDLTTQDGRCD